MYKRNVYVGWTDVKKADDSVFQEFIIEMLNFIKAPKWIIGWLKEAMRTWRTIQQVKEGKQFKLSREIETVEFFRGFPEPHTVLHSVYDCVIDYEKFKTGICTRTTIK